MKPPSSRPEVSHRLWLLTSFLAITLWILSGYLLTQSTPTTSLQFIWTLISLGIIGLALPVLAWVVTKLHNHRFSLVLFLYFIVTFPVVVAIYIVNHKSSDQTKHSKEKNS